MVKYELLLLGAVPAAARTVISKNLSDLATEFELAMPGDLMLRTAADAAYRERTASIAALYFGGDPTVDLALVDELERDKVPVIPVMPAGAKLEGFVPTTLLAINASFIDPIDFDYRDLTATALESLGLLRRQRRIFLSYRRDDSRHAALQLHDELSGRGFDVFLDTHDIRPGEPFQEMLWHRLADCDVVIMLDTPDYFTSKWTKQELGRSLASGISILRVVWPGIVPTRYLSLSDTVSLGSTDLDASLRLSAAKIQEIARRTEQLRAHSVASRHRTIAGTLRIEVERIGGKFEGIGSHRAMALSLPNGLKLQAYPVVGVPTAETLNDVHEKAANASKDFFPCLVYDHKGLRPKWLEHLKWLDEHIKPVRALQAFNAGWELAVWDSNS